MRLHRTSTGLDPGALRPGHDLVLDLDPLHGVEAAHGTYVMDHLDAGGRRAADATAVAALAGWRERFDARLTVEGICWPLVWQLPLHNELDGRVARALALREALRVHGPRTLELADTDVEAERMAHAVGGALGVDVGRVPGARAVAAAGAAVPALSGATRVRRGAARRLVGLGAPTVLRRGSVAIHAYWPLMGLLDRMLTEPGHRPALFVAKRPTSVRRALATARRGGVVGSPTPADRRWARPRAAELVAATRSDVRIDADGIDLGGLLHPRIVALAERRAADDLAHARCYRRAFRRGPARIVGAYDVSPEARLIVLLAREASVHTVLLCHGAFVLPQPLADLDLCDEVALWSRATAPPITNLDRPIHLVGYPLPHAPPPPTRRAPTDRPVRIAIMGQTAIDTTCTLDERVTMATFVTAIEAIARRFADAEVVLRPNPLQDSSFFARLRERYPQVDLQERRGGDIVAVHRAVDLTIGSASTATYQAVLAGTPVIVLNLTGTEWAFPLGGEHSTVPIARSAEALDDALSAWQRDGCLPGREDLVDALGVRAGDGVDRLLAVVDGTAPAPPPFAP